MLAKRIKEYTEAIGNSFGDNSIFSFIDGTEVHIYRPSEEDQRLFWNSHKK